MVINNTSPPGHWSTADKGCFEIRSGASLVNMEQLADSTEKLALEIPPLVRENLEGAPETREEIIAHCRGVNRDILITARGKVPENQGAPSQWKPPHVT